MRRERKVLVCKVILLVCVIVLPVSGQTFNNPDGFTKAEIAFSNGNFAKAIQLAGTYLEKAKVLKKKTAILTGLEIMAYSQIALKKLDEAEVTVQEALSIVSDNQVELKQKASIFFCASWLKRQQRQIPEALDYSKKALSVNPDSPGNQGEYYLNIGRILFSMGFDISAVIWLEKAESKLTREKTISPALLETYRFLMHSWSSKANFNSALVYSEKLVRSVKQTKYLFKNRQALFEKGVLLSATGQKAKAYKTFNEGLQLSLKENDSFYSREYLNTIILNLLYDNSPEDAAKYLPQLEKLDGDNEFSFEILLIKGIISAFERKTDSSEKIFQELENKEKTNHFILPSWKAIIAKKNGDWEKLIILNQELMKLAEKYQSREELPQILLSFAKAYFHLNQLEKAAGYLEKSLALIEEIRQSENSSISLGILETYHDAYRLLTQINFDKPQKSFELGDFIKARLLKDKINNSALKTVPIISNEVREKLEALSLKYIEDQTGAGEIDKIEKSITIKFPEVKLSKPDLSDLDTIPDLNNAAIISYFFTLDKNLMVFVWEKGKSLRRVQLPISEDEVEQTAAKTQEDIKNRVFFKRDGKRIFDKLLAPLGLSSKHLIIIPDKSLWKIPFQALSSDGEKYLIEEKIISYAPSISILLEQLKNLKPNRQTLQAFANSLFENRTLQNVNAEATTAARIYNSQPIMNATINDFERFSDKSDILHFSMHAEVDNDQPLDSFLGFKKFGKDAGRLTVEELLNIKLKKGSLVFLASCDTNNVLSGEGLVSLAWAMMGSGATTVISSGWEANDKSTAVFTSSFYKNYKQGSSAAEAMQKAAFELIKDKSSNMHEPYYWADFTLNGDFR